MSPDYRQLMDAQTWAFIDRINSFYPPEAIDWPIAKNRAVYDEMSRAFHAGRPDGIDVEDLTVDAGGHDLRLRLYRPAEPRLDVVLFYMHGGGFILGDLDSHDDICAEICARARLPLVSVDYRLAPEHLGDAALRDALTGFDWTRARFHLPVVTIGESAGGNLAAALANELRGKDRPSGQVLIYPSLGGETDRGSYVTHSNAPLLSTDDVEVYRRVRTPGEAVPCDPRYEPLAASDFAGLPPTMIFTAECDPLASDGPDYRDRILFAGGWATCREDQGLPHGYLRARHMVDRAGAAFAAIIDGISSLAGHAART